MNKSDPSLSKCAYKKESGALMVELSITFAVVITTLSGILLLGARIIYYPILVESSRAGAALISDRSYKGASDSDLMTFLGCTLVDDSLVTAGLDQSQYNISIRPLAGKDGLDLVEVKACKSWVKFAIGNYNRPFLTCGKTVFALDRLNAIIPSAVADCSEVL